MKKRLLSVVVVTIMLLSAFVIAPTASEQTKTKAILSQMTTEDKIAQMIMPAFRYSTDEEGNRTNVTEITDDISECLNKHGFSGVILFGQNISGNAQTTRLVDQLQKANAANSSHTQLLISTDQEGGMVTRLAHGTTMMGNMALGAINDTEVTKEAATVIGSECKALGINVDFAPDVDVNNNPANPVIGTRSFSDDPQLVAKHGSAFVKALNGTGVVSTLKHFPGHGDTDTDSHTGLPMVDKSYDELMQNELIPFKACIDSGSQMIMTAHIQYPQIEKDTYTSVLDGEQIYIPATLSDDIIGGVLREKLGYNGVVVTDAMEMDAIAKHFDKYDAAKLAIGAGVDILLMPVDTTSKAGFAEMDEYISTLAKKADDGEISMSDIDAAVLRILTLKENNDLLDSYSVTDIEKKVENAVNTVGTKATHDRELELTKKAITLVKNDNNTLPLTNKNQKTAVLVPYNNELNSMLYAVDKLKADGKLPEGSSADVISYYQKTAEEVLHLIEGADNVVFVSEISGASGLTNAKAQLADEIENKIHSDGGKFIVLSNSLPYDAARFQKADAIMIAYLDAGMSELPGDKEQEIQKYGPNMPAAMYMMFSADDAPTAKLPINIPKLDENYSFTGETLYARGYGLTYGSEEPISEPDTTPADEETRVEKLISKMTLDQKISQMIMPAFRSWNSGSGSSNVQELSKAPELAEALRRHQYGGVILFGQNISDTEQTTRLISDLQKNNANSTDAAKTGVIPYMVSADEEGGSVARLSMGTRGTGSMAIGATGEKAGENARKIGEVFGEEMAALGINVNLAPCVDVIKDLSDLGMSTRVYSDDPAINAELGTAFAEGLGENNVIAAYKHFPGAGDGSDYPTSINLTLDELKANGLSAYQEVIKNGAEMLMISATTFPQIDDEQLMADGVTKGYYPATTSHKIVTDMLRKELGFDGVVITDALEMEQFITEPDNKKQLFPGNPGTVGYDIQVAKYAINAGCDILLLPTDMNDASKVTYYDDYITGIEDLVKKGEIDEKSIDASVKRILSLKEKRGILDMDTSGKDVEDKIAQAKKIVGSDEHHAIEKDTAEQAVTLLKNDNGTLPVSGKKNILFIGYSKLCNTPISYAVSRLKQNGILAENTRIENQITESVEGDENADSKIVIDYFYKDGTNAAGFDRLSEEIQKADVVVCLSSTSAGDEPLVQLQDDYYMMQGVSRALSETHAAGARFVLISANLPLDTARFTDADAIVCAYLGVGFGIDPIARTSGSENAQAFNANVPAAISAIFTGNTPGKLPINIPKLDENYRFTDEILYARGYGLTCGSEEPASEPATTEPVQPEKTDISAMTATLAKTSYAYTGKAIEPAVTIPGLTSSNYALSYKNNKNAGTATVTITGKGNYKGTIIKTFKITKVKQNMTAAVHTKTVKASKLKKSKVIVKKTITVKNSKGTVTYRKLSGSKYLTISKKGIITVKKGKLKKQTLKIKVKVTAEGNSNYKAKTLTKTVKIRIK